MRGQNTCTSFKGMHFWARTSYKCATSPSQQYIEHARQTMFSFLPTSNVNISKGRKPKRAKESCLLCTREVGFASHLLELALLPEERGAGIIDFLDRGIMLQTPKGTQKTGGATARDRHDELSVSTIFRERYLSQCRSSVEPGGGAQHAVHSRHHVRKHATTGHHPCAFYLR